MSDGVVDLDALVGVAGEVRFGGKTRDVLPIDGAGYTALLRMRERKDDPGAVLETMVVIVKRCCPSIAAEQVESMNLQQLSAIMKIAGKIVKGVENHPKSKRRPSGVAPPRSRD